MTLALNVEDITCDESPSFLRHLSRDIADKRRRHFSFNVDLHRPGAGVALALNDSMLDHSRCADPEDDGLCDVRFCIHYQTHFEYINQPEDWTREFGPHDPLLMYVPSQLGSILRDDVKYRYQVPTLEPIAKRARIC